MLSMSEAEQLVEDEANEAVGFLQFFHLRRESEAINQLATCPALVDAACSLLGCKRVRMYQVRALLDAV
jgi:hypothetical protein